VVGQVGAEFFDALLRLNNLIHFLTAKEFRCIDLLRHDLLPDIDHAHGEREREFDQENS